MPARPLTYKDAGVDLELYDQAMQRLPALMARTHGPRVVPLADGFAGLFRLHAEGRRYEDPILVSGTDGVGTKIKVAIRTQVYDTVGIDLVAMCVNDCLCVGAEPLFFLDYLALGKDDPDLVASLVRGVSNGCVQAGAALLGGETAIMPAVYAPGDFDLAGFCVGVVERSQLIDGAAIQSGDVVLGVASSGLHSNGFSLVRKIVFDSAGLDVDDPLPECGGSVGQTLLTPTRIYADVVAALRSDAETAGAVTGIAHITGGGLVDNISRILPAGCRVQIQRGSWDVPPVFAWLQQLGSVDRAEMYSVFNMGIGLVLIVRAAAADGVRKLLERLSAPHWTIGEVVAGTQDVVYLD